MGSSDESVDESVDEEMALGNYWLSTVNDFFFVESDDRSLDCVWPDSFCRICEDS